MCGCRASIVAAVFFVAASIASPVGAAEPTHDAGIGIVVFAVDPLLKDAQAMVDAVRAHLTGLPVRLVVDTGNGVSEPSQDSRRIGTLTIDPSNSNEWVVSFTEPAIDTTLVRRIRLKPQGKRVALEEAAIVVRSMVEAILDGGHVGIARPRAEENASASASSVLGRPRQGITATAGYLGTTFASGLGWQSGGIIGLRWQSNGFYGGITSQLFAPITTETSPASLILIRHPGAIVFGYEGAGRLAPTIEMEIMVDYVTRSNGQIEEGYDPTPSSSRWFFGVGAMAGVSWTIVPRLRLLAQAGVDGIINPYSYVVSPNIFVVRSSAIRPKTGIGVGVDLW